MTRAEALTIMQTVWGTPGTLPAYAADMIEAEAKGGETSLETCARIAGVDINGVQPFDHATMRNRIAAAEVAHAREVRAST
jgi:hypothetical protein